MDITDLTADRSFQGIPIAAPAANILKLVAQSRAGWFLDPDDRLALEGASPEAVFKVLLQLP